MCGWWRWEDDEGVEGRYARMMKVRMVDGKMMDGGTI